MQRLDKGFNAVSSTYEALFKAGILDATKVVRLALQEAVSIASMMVTKKVVIADKPEPPAAAGDSGGDPMGNGW